MIQALDLAAMRVRREVEVPIGVRRTSRCVPPPHRDAVRRPAIPLTALASGLLMKLPMSCRTAPGHADSSAKTIEAHVVFVGPNGSSRGLPAVTGGLPDTLTRSPD